MRTDNYVSYVALDHGKDLKIENNCLMTLGVYLVFHSVQVVRGVLGIQGLQGLQIFHHLPVVLAVQVVPGLLAVHHFHVSQGNRLFQVVQASHLIQVVQGFLGDQVVQDCLEHHFQEYQENLWDQVGQVLQGHLKSVGRASETELTLFFVPLKTV